MALVCPQCHAAREGTFLADEYNIFNYRLTRARRVIENAFGIMTARFRLLRKTMLATKRTAKLIIQAIVVLHNYLMERAAAHYAPPDFVDREDWRGNVVRGGWRAEALQDGPEPLGPQDPVGGAGDGPLAEAIREEFVQYFLTEGAVPWQWRHLRRI
ncbi:uncharacterized protein LOC117640430 [Thrips palmi]|uniref:Uncharacterized protein LOC117640430 n=1 Tax=Thrips palmi TaxID=161013 RepID=A0A6P8Y9K7_THRPL|nr:uncharacterized protein LOC117640430 [Thrips palmi]